MAYSETFLKAAFNRIKARLEKKIVSSIKQAAVEMRHAPEQLQKEWELFKDEIADEASRLEAIDDLETASQTMSSKNSEMNTAQERIDNMRRKVKKLIKEVEGRN